MSPRKTPADAEQARLFAGDIAAPRIAPVLAYVFHNMLLVRRVQQRIACNQVVTQARRYHLARLHIPACRLRIH